MKEEGDKKGEKGASTQGFPASARQGAVARQSTAESDDHPVLRDYRATFPG